MNSTHLLLKTQFLLKQGKYLKIGNGPVQPQSLIDLLASSTNNDKEVENEDIEMEVNNFDENSEDDGENIVS